MAATQVLVTGYGGFLGAAICRQLLARGMAVRGLARGDYPELRGLGVQTLRGDVANPSDCAAACRGCDVVVHTAAKAGVWGRWEDYYQTNTAATQVLLGTAIEQGVHAFVYTSSPSVTFDGRHQSGADETEPYPQRWLCHYPQTKALAEQAVTAAAEQGKVMACSLRPHLIWGQGDPHLFPRVIQRAISGRLMRVGSGQNLIDVVHVDNAARAHLLAMDRLLDNDQRLNGQRLFITDGQPVACWEWISHILTTAGLPVPKRSISFRTAYRLGAIFEGVFRALRRTSEPPMTRFVAAQLALDHYFNIDQARTLLGYQPSIDRSAEFSRCADWLHSLAMRPV
ncbi:MAG: NAD-dependent epimerase/dehydratase family protein [Pirellulaceae bacterium]|nr:NAD-dependent epimerase/dehydratase family protein [Pirellulaceae bacterium]